MHEWILSVRYPTTAADLIRFAYDPTDKILTIKPLHLLEMAHTKAMGLGAMFVLLVIAVVFLPMFVRYIDRWDSYYSISGFQDGSGDVSNIPQVPGGMTSLDYQHDPNTDYLRRTPCPEGQFFDGPSKTCIDPYVKGKQDPSGYFS